MAPTKAELRLVLRARRAAEPAAAARARAERIADAATRLRPLAGVAVAAYWATNAEPDVTALVEALGLPLYVPRVAADQLDWVASPSASIAGPRTGIPCPPGPALARGAGVVDLGVGLMLVPALAVDPATGIRLGYGRGFYDRLLASAAPAQRARLHAVGVCRAEELVPLPRNAHDQPLDGVVTEAGYQAVGTPPHSAA